MLADSGRLSLDDPVEAVPEVQFADPYVTRSRCGPADPPRGSAIDYQELTG
jgi:hypothetical protein